MVNLATYLGKVAKASSVQILIKMRAWVSSADRALLYLETGRARHRRRTERWPVNNSRRVRYTPFIH